MIISAQSSFFISQKNKEAYINKMKISGNLHIRDWLSKLLTTILSHSEPLQQNRLLVDCMEDLQPDRTAIDAINKQTDKQVCLLQWFIVNSQFIRNLPKKTKEDFLTKVISLYVSLNRPLYSLLNQLFEVLSPDKTKVKEILDKQSNSVINHFIECFPSLLSDNELPSHFVSSSSPTKVGVRTPLYSPSKSPTKNKKFDFNEVSIPTNGESKPKPKSKSMSNRVLLFLPPDL